ncbi:hypothetical protein M770_07575 [Pseudomonas aeruginosa VRFPA03]|nr:hypothetical protein M770_07575 [Pseudomonas aeruginosa VRFPA03]
MQGRRRGARLTFPACRFGGDRSSAWRACWVLALASLALGGLAWLGLDYGARP